MPNCFCAEGIYASEETATKLRSGFGSLGEERNTTY